MEWIKCSERLPEIPPKYFDKEWEQWVTPMSVRILLFDGEDVFEGYYNEDGSFNSSSGHSKISHWMPLPNPPQE